MPRSRWKRVPAAGISPADSAVEPRGRASRSMTTHFGARLARRQRRAESGRPGADDQTPALSPRRRAPAASRRVIGAHLGQRFGDGRHRATGLAARRSAVSCTVGEKAAQPSSAARSLEIAHMRVAHGRGDAAVGDDAADIELFDARLAQHPFEPASCRRRNRRSSRPKDRRARARRRAHGPRRPARNRPCAGTAAAPSDAARSAARRPGRAPA